MGRKVVTLDLCDLCQELDDAEVEAEYSMILNGVELLWCENHNAKGWTIEEAIELFGTHGTKLADQRQTRTSSKGRVYIPRSTNKAQLSEEMARKRKSGERYVYERKYQCEYPGCDRDFHREDYYIRHKERVHEGVLPDSFECDFPGCGRVCWEQQGLNQHRRRAHGYTGPYEESELAK